MRRSRIATSNDDLDERVVRYALRRRGIHCGAGRHEGILASKDPAAADRFYELLRRYSFRLFLRDLIGHRERATIEDLTRYCSSATAERYLGELSGMGLARMRKDGTFRLRNGTVHSFGPTLEWFVATALRREFGIASAWNLRPDGARGGGDYDVVGVADGALIYVEVKSSAPRNIERRQIGAFVDRLDALAPDVAVLLNDTQLRMLDKLVPALRAELRRRPFASGPIRRVQGEIFSRADRLFITNSEPDLIANLGTCLSRFLRSRAG